MISNSKLGNTYRRTLLAYLRGRNRVPPLAAHRCGAPAMLGDLGMAEFARQHEDFLISQVLPAHPRRRHAELIRRSGAFFALAITSAPQKRSPTHAVVRLKRSIELLSSRTVALAHANQALSDEITQRKAAEHTLLQNEQRYASLLKHSDLLQDQLRNMSRQLLSAQEVERRRISRELHDVIAQTLSNINIRLAVLKKDSSQDALTLDRNVARTQRMVIKAVEIVHRFARELRPAVLDDLGLVPALTAFVGPLAKRAGFLVKITVCKRAELLSTEQRTVFFRVAQEALNNIARHADASRVELSMSSASGYITLQVHDNGRTFDVPRYMLASRGKRLGLLGMRERLEMLGGTFEVVSKVGHGTTVTGRMPIRGPDATLMTRRTRTQVTKP